MKFKVALIGLVLTLASAMPAHAYIAGLRWLGANCVQTTMRGRVIGTFPRNVCRMQLGTVRHWRGLQCGEFTPAGFFLKWLPFPAQSCRFATIGLNDVLKDGEKNSSSADNAVADLEDSKAVSAPTADAPAQTESIETKLQAE